MMKAWTCLLALLPSLALAGTEHFWWTNETSATYMEWPGQLQGRLGNEWAIYQTDQFPLPIVRVFQTVPTDPALPHPWPLLKSMTRRMHPILWPRVHYQVHDGVEFGCRSPQGVVDPSGHCHRHCIHQGRYCLDHAQNHDGRVLLKEAVRRLCVDTIYHAKDPRFIHYLHDFEASAKCIETDSAVALNNCSLHVMKNVGIKWANITHCVLEGLEDQDVQHPALERNYRHLKARPFNASLPLITIDDHITRMDTSLILGDYCQAFPSYLQQPLACHVCKDCDNVRDCLWSLTCNGVPFDPNNVQEDVVNAAPEQMSQFETEVPTPEPQGTSQGQTVEGKEDQEQEEEDNTPDTVADHQQETPTTTSNQEALEANDGNGGFLFWFLLLAVLMPLSCLGLAYYYTKFKHERARKLLREIAAGKYTDGVFKFYRDQPDDTTADKDQELGGRQSEEDFSVPHSVRNRATNVLSKIEEAERYRSAPPATDLLSGGDGRAGDMLDEESEWVEHRRSAGKAPPVNISNQVIC